MTYDVLIIGGGPGGIYTAWELLNKRPDLKLALFESGHTLERRRCPIDGVKVKSCVHCPTCAIMNGFGGAGAFSDGKYNITNQFGGTLHEHIGKKKALELMEYVDQINMENGGEGTKLYSTGNTRIKKLCLENDLHLLDASVRHLGTDINYVVLEHLYAGLKDRMDIFFDTPVRSVEKLADGYAVTTDKERYEGRTCVISVGRSGSKWMEEVCTALKIPTSSNRVDIGVRVELPYEVFAHLTDELYESKIVYRTEKFQDRVRTFCMNPKGVVVNENTNGIVTVNGHSYEDPALHTENTNFALLVSNRFTSPFNEPYRYGKHIASLSNMLAGGVLVYGIPEFRLNKDVVRREIKELLHLGVEIKTNTLIGPDYTVDDLFSMGYDAIFMGTGTSLPRTLNIPGKELTGILTATYFLRMVVLSDSGKLDESETLLHVGDNVIVIGAGNVAMDAARTAIRRGAKNVTVVYHKTEAEISCFPSEYEAAVKEGVQFNFLQQPIAYLNKKQMRALNAMRQKASESDETELAGLLVQNIVKTEDGQFIEEGGQVALPCDCVILAIGQRPAARIVSTTKGIQVDDRGFVITRERPYGMTTRAGVFSSGDVVHGPATVVLAMKESKKVAAGIAQYIDAKKLLAECEEVPENLK